MSIKHLLGKILFSIQIKSRNLIARYQKTMFAECGDHVSVGYGSDFVHSHIHCGHHVQIGNHSSFIASIAHIYIGNYVRFGPNVTIRGGNHRIDVIGKHIYEVTDAEKRPTDDEDVVIEDGVWVGCNVAILKGVRLGRGCVVGAGSVVVKDIPPYAVAAGNPARILKYRFTEKEIIEHEKCLKQ